MNSTPSNYSSNGYHYPYNNDQYGHNQKSVTVTKNAALQVQDKVQQLVNDTSARYFADMEKIIEMHSKGFQPMFSAYAPGDQDIKKRLQNVEMATLALKIQVSQASKDPSLPPVKLCRVPEYHLMHTIEIASRILDPNIRAFLLENLNTFRTQVAREIPVALPEQYAAPNSSHQGNHASAQEQEKLMGMCNLTHDIGDQIEKRLKQELPTDNSRYDIPVTPLITEAEVNGVSNSHRRKGHHGSHSPMNEEIPHNLGNHLSRPAPYQGYRS